MTFRHSNEVRKLPSSRFDSATQRYLMIEISHLADSEGIIRQAQTDIANDSLLSRVTVANEIKRLESKGLILKEKHGRYKVNIFLAGQASAEAISGEEQGNYDFDMWWEDNALSEKSGAEAVVFPIDETPEAVKQYMAEGKLKPRKGTMIHQGEWCIAYDRN